MTMQGSLKKFNATIFILVLLFTITALQKVSFAQDRDKSTKNKQNNQDETIRVDTNLVTIPATVFDREGRYVANLKKEDFQIFENGVEQEVSLFETVEEPFTVLILLDRSGSMTEYLLQLANASSAFVRQLRPDDQVIAVSFADDVDVLVKATKVIDLGKGIKIRDHADDHQTRLYDAVDYSLKKMKKISGRKSIIVFSDGMGDGIFASFKSNLRDAEEGEALIYTIQFNTSPKSPPSYVSKKSFYEGINEANIYMKNLAQIAGGRSYKIEDISNLEETFAQIAKELGQQYSIGYYPKQAGKNGERKQIKVKVNIPNAAVRARDSYVVGNSKK